MQKIRILIVSYHNQKYIGGIETYQYLLTKYLPKDKYEIYEIFHELEDEKKNKDSKLIVRKEEGNSILLPIQNKRNQDFICNSQCIFNGKNFFKSILIGLQIFFKCKKSTKFYDKKYNFDIIIDNTVFYRLTKERNKTFFVQHSSPYGYKTELTRIKIINKLIYFFAKLFKIEKISYYKNFVFYSKEDAKEFNLKNKNEFQIFLPYFQNFNFSSENEILKRKNIIWRGRIIDPQKGIKWLKEISSYINDDIFVYGNGPASNLISNIKNIKLMPSYKIENLPKIINNYKFNFITSNEEGACFVAIESLANGVPIITRDTYLAAKFYVDNGKNGLLIPKDATIEQATELINNFLKMDDEKYLEMCKNAYEFAKKHFSVETFINKWENAIDTVLKNKK
ncbi:glycosyltransferase family 4 protein [[Mycoplasma] collis]|uniref:glycosyltransferase family 4 protein n=1 Tax=[Mycoplasma] collis TaxID=2127 RepID=UPI00051C5C25|nr:glycosyltransferase [[Mycoplasma] collis]